jgi:hypothetical protein
MKKKILFLCVCAFAISISSCKKKNDEVVDKPLTLSPLTVEQQKTSLEDNGIALATKMEELENSDAMSAIGSFVQSMQNMNSQPQLVKAFSGLKSNVSSDPQKTVTKFYSQLSTAVANNESLWGTWIYSSVNNTFEKESSSTDKKATFKFPTKNSTSNNATLNIVYVESNLRVPGEATKLPQSLTLTINVGSKEVLNCQNSVSFNSDLTPSSLKETLKIDKFNWTFNYTSDTKNIEEKSSLMFDKDVLFKFEFTTSGNFALYDIVSQVESMNSYSQNKSIIANTGAIYVQVMNVGIYGSIKDIKTFLSKIVILDLDSKYLDSKSEYSSITEMVNLLNSNIVAYAYFVDKKEKIADLEFYVGEEEYVEMIYDYKTNNYTEITKTNKTPKARLLMSDKSKQDIEAFIATGFEKLHNKISSMTADTTNLVVNN